MASAPQSSVLARPRAAAPSPRERWRATRLRMEAELRRTGRVRGVRRIRFRDRAMLGVLACGLKMCALYRYAARAAYEIVLREVELCFAHLPPAFDGFTILHLSDLHLDGMPRLADRALAAWDGREVDLCVLTGDYRAAYYGGHEAAMAELHSVVAGIRSRHAPLAVLGNHDDCHMVAPMEQMGLRVLLNESAEIVRGGDALHVVGTDDVRTYYTDQALRALEAAGERGFCIALIHSAELFDAACALGVDLYLCGHTHGGQVCLPGGRAIVKHLSRGRAFYRGPWHYCGMKGFTHSGVGTSGPPVRLNTRGELVVLRLRRVDEEAPR